MAHGVRTWGNSPDGETVLLIGTYQTAAAAGQLVTSALPALAVFTEHETDPVLLNCSSASSRTRAWAGECLGPGPGLPAAAPGARQRTSAPKMTSRAGRRAPATPWLPRALALLHEEPAAPWTVAELARRAHVSRATMAARFHTAVGQPPMAYLTAWRLALAADRLASSAATTAVIADEVGYSNAFTFSAAFSRAYGVSPRATGVPPTARASTQTAR